MVHDYELNPTIPYKTARSRVKKQIVIHQLIFIAALVLIPLLTWHIATLNFFEDYRMQKGEESTTKKQVSARIVERIMKTQLSESKVALWAAVWVLTSCDAIYALWYLGRCQSQLHPKMGEEAGIAGNATEYVDALDERTLQADEQQSGRMADKAPATDHQTKLSRSSMSSSLNHLKAPSQYPNIRTYTCRICHLALQLLPLACDISIILFLTLHISTFLSLIEPTLAVCDTDEVSSYPNSNLPIVKFGDLSPHGSFSMRERCERYNLHLIIAGGFSSTVAALLVAAHLASLLCRILETVYLIKARAKERRDLRAVAEEQAEADEWHVQPRDIDIHVRGQAPSERPGRLTVISEEEQSIGGGLTRRRQADKPRSGESGISRIDFGAQGRREEGFLECLVP